MEEMLILERAANRFCEFHCGTKAFKDGVFKGTSMCEFCSVRKIICNPNINISAFMNRGVIK